MATIAQVVAKTGVARISVHRHAPPRPAEAVTADGAAPAAERGTGQEAR